MLVFMLASQPGDGVRAATDSQLSGSRILPTIKSQHPETLGDSVGGGGGQIPTKNYLIEGNKNLPIACSSATASEGARPSRGGAVSADVGQASQGHWWSPNPPRGLQSIREKYSYEPHFRGVMHFWSPEKDITKQRSMLQNFTAWFAFALPFRRVQNRGYQDKVKYRDEHGNWAEQCFVHEEVQPL